MAYILYIYIYDRYLYLTYLTFYISPSIRMQISWKHRFLLYSLLLPKLLRRVPNIYIRYSINIWWINEWITEWIYIQSQSEILCFLYVYRCPVLVSCKRNHFWFSQTKGDLLGCYHGAPRIVKDRRNRPGKQVSLSCHYDGQKMGVTRTFWSYLK